MILQPKTEILCPGQRLDRRTTTMGWWVGGGGDRGRIKFIGQRSSLVGPLSRFQVKRSAPVRTIIAVAIGNAFAIIYGQPVLPRRYTIDIVHPSSVLGPRAWKIAIDPVAGWLMVVVVVAAADFSRKLNGPASSGDFYTSPVLTPRRNLVPPYPSRFFDVFTRVCSGVAKDILHVVPGR